jgi:hypothetical protein
MRRGVSVEGSILAVVLCAVLAACGGTTSGSSGGNSGATNATMQAGQWEFVVTPTNGGPAQYLEANLADSGNGVFSTVFNTEGYSAANGGCVNFSVSANISGNSLTGSVSSGGSTTGTFSATAASNGQSVSKGSYSGESPDCDSAGTFTFTGYTVAPLNGTFTGTLSGENGPDQITISVAQNANFGITASGTSVQAGVTSQLAITPDGTPTDNTGGYSNVIGALLEVNGTATNANGSESFQVVGRFNASGTQIQILAFGSDVETGTLTKQ